MEIWNIGSLASKPAMNLISRTSCVWPSPGAGECAVKGRASARAQSALPLTANLTPARPYGPAHGQLCGRPLVENRDAKPRSGVAPRDRTGARMHLPFGISVC